MSSIGMPNKGRFSFGERPFLRGFDWPCPTLFWLVTQERVIRARPTLRSGPHPTLRFGLPFASLTRSKLAYSRRQFCPPSSGLHGGTMLMCCNKAGLRERSLMCKPDDPPAKGS